MKQNIILLLSFGFLLAAISLFFIKDVHAASLPLSVDKASGFTVVDLEPFVVSVIVNGELERTLNVGVRFVIPKSLEAELEKRKASVRNIINRDFYNFFPREIASGALSIDLNKIKKRLLRNLKKETSLDVENVLIRYFYAR